MASLALSCTTSLFDRVTLSFGRRRGGTHRDHPASDRSPDDARLRREFIHDMLTRNPGAFASDLDVQAMMCLFPRQF